MADTRIGPVFSQLCGSAAVPCPEGVSDGQLLERFLARRDETAFAALLRRHGRMVLHVCRRMLRHPQDAEDAFQATFLLLAQKAASIRKQESVASWLYGVAYHLALRARAQADRRRAEERRAADARPDGAGLRAAWEELQAVLDEELHRLPPKYQAALVLCYLEGRTHEEAARQLGCPLGTVRSRVARARAMLKRRLEKRGLALPAATLATLLAADVAGAVPARLLQATCAAAPAHAAGHAVPAGLVTSEAAALAKGGLTAMTATRLKLGAILFVAVGVVAAGLTAGAPPVPVPAGPAQAEAPKKKATPARTDRHGDPLPPEAVARLGSVRHWPSVPQSGQTLTFTSDSKHVALVGPDKAVLIWDAASGKETARVGGSKAAGPGPYGLVFSADDRRLAVIEGPSHIRVWDVKANKELAHLSNLRHGFALRCAFSPDGKQLIVPGRDGLVHRWDTVTWKELTACEGHKGPVNAASFSADGRSIVSGGNDQTVRLWDAATGKQVKSFLKHRNQVFAVAFAPDGKSIASWGGDAAVRVWEAASGADVRTWKNPAPPSHQWGGHPIVLNFSPDGKTLVFGDSFFAGFRTVDVSSGAQVRSFAGRGPASMAVSPDGKLIACGGSNQGPLRIYDAVSGEEQPRWRGGHEAPILAVAFAPDRKTLATSGLDKTIRLWNPATGAELKKLTGHSGVVSCLCFSPDGKHLASASRDRDDCTVSWWDVASGKEVQQFPGHTGGVVALDSTADGKLRVISSGGALRVWDPRTGAKVREELRPGLGSASFVPDGKTVVFSEPGSSLGLRIWDTTKEGGALRNYPKPPGRAYWPQLAFSSDGRLMLAAATDNSMHLWDFPAQKMVRTLARTEAMMRPFPPPALTAALGAFSPDTRTVGVPYKGGAVALMELATGKVRHLFRGQQGIVTVVAFSPDGAVLVSGGEDGSALVWDMQAVGPAPKEDLTAEQLEALWKDLGGADALKAYWAVRTLASSPGQAVPFLRKRQPPVPATAQRQIEQYITDLGAKQFSARKNAEQELKKLGQKARLAMEKALKAKPTLDVAQRLERLLRGLDEWKFTPDEVQTIRAVEVVEAARTGEAKLLLQEWAKGADAALLTEEAKAALARLTGR
jgi:RNA polymerase sigma factor (sigma-70 family)